MKILNGLRRKVVPQPGCDPQNCQQDIDAIARAALNECNRLLAKLG
jgi:hypothetical protein